MNPSSPAELEPVEKPSELVFKFIIVGDYAAGKTSIIHRYCKGSFTENYKVTIGVDFSSKTIKSGEKTAVLNLFDIAGHERFGSMLRLYYRHSAGAVVVFDVTRESTFDTVRRWANDIDEKVHLADETPIPKILLANKVDLVGNPENELDKERLDALCEELGFTKWFATSAKTGEGLEEAFSFLVEEVYAIRDKIVWSQRPSDGVGRVTIGAPEGNAVKKGGKKGKKKSGGGCC